MLKLRREYKCSRSLIMFMSTLLLLGSCEIADDLAGGNATVAKLEGEWTCDETSEFYKSTTSSYEVSISPDPDNENGVIIDSFYGLDDAVYAQVSGMSLVVSLQTASGGYEVSGSGVIAGNYREINWTYEVDDGSGVIDHCTAVYTKN